MRRAPLVVCLAAILMAPGLAARGQAQADAADLSGVVVALATRESASYYPGKKVGRTILSDSPGLSDRIVRPTGGSSLPG